MDFAAEISRAYRYLENDHVDKAVMSCLRIARNLKDHFYTAVFLRELYPKRREFVRILYDDTRDLNEEAQKFLFHKSFECWLDTHKLDFSLGRDEEGEELRIIGISVTEFDSSIEQLEKSIQDMAVPSGMDPFDTAAFTEKFANAKARIRVKIRATQMVKEQVRARCLNYTIRVERQLDGQSKSQNFLEGCQNEVNNFFKGRSEEVFSKLEKASELLDSGDSENLSLLLTQVRRAIKAAADYFYPPADGPVKCADGQARPLGDDQYLNRLREYLSRTFEKSSSHDLLCAELDLLAVFVRRLNEIACKGVHANVSPQEAKQGLLGLYMFLYNVISRLHRQSQ